MKKRIECKITGRVQMVMFRDYAQRKGSKLGLVGTVQNMPDKSVFLVAEGEDVVLEKYTTLLKKGSVLSRVDNIEVSEKTPTDEFQKFRIVYNK